MIIEIQDSDVAFLEYALGRGDDVARTWMTANQSSGAERELGRLRVEGIQRISLALEVAKAEGR